MVVWRNRVHNSYLPKVGALVGSGGSDPLTDVLGENEAEDAAEVDNVVDAVRVLMEQSRAQYALNDAQKKEALDNMLNKILGQSTIKQYLKVCKLPTASTTNHEWSVAS